MNFNCPLYPTFKQTDGQEIDLTEQDVYTEKDKLEIVVHPKHDPENWIQVSSYIFRSWTGPRRINGEPYDGPVFYLGSTKRATTPNTPLRKKARKIYGHWRS
jgi:hypothetical protein